MIRKRLLEWADFYTANLSLVFVLAVACDANLLKFFVMLILLKMFKSVEEILK